MSAFFRTQGLIFFVILFFLPGCARYFTSLSPAFEPENQPLQYPKSCYPVGVHFVHDQLQVERPQKLGASLLLIANHSGQDITLDRSMKVRSASAGWDSLLKPKHWSALQFEGINFNIVCKSEALYGKFVFVNCESLLQACWLPVAAVDFKRLRGGYWVAENLKLTTLFQAIKNKGFQVSAP